MSEIEKMNILAVDDREENLVALEAMLEGPHVNIVKALSGNEALGLMLDYDFALTLLDVQMPEMDGFEVAKLMRRTEKTRHIPIIFVTAINKEDSFVLQGYETGAVDYLFKPVIPEILRSKVNVFLELHRQKCSLEQTLSELDQARNILARKNEEIRSFYHYLAHELKSPLSSATEFVSITLDGLAGPLTDEQHQYLGLARESCNQIRIYINDLLDVARLENGKLKIRCQSGSLDALIRRVEAVVSREAKEKQIAFSSDIQPGLPWVTMDESRIFQVLINLLKNAMKFTPEEGRVTVRAEIHPQEQDRILVSVKDTGRGIEKEKQEHIFDRFFQVRKDDMEIEGGLGMGLHLCRELVQLHGGEISVESALGEGSTFFFTLPRSEVEAEDRALTLQ